MNRTRERKQENEARALCERCKRQPERYVVTIVGVVTVVARLCTRCCHAAIIRYPAGKAVEIA